MNPIFAALSKATPDEVKEFLAPFAIYKKDISCLGDVVNLVEVLSKFKSNVLETEMKKLREVEVINEKKVISEDLKKVGLTLAHDSTIVATIHSLKEEDRPSFIKELLSNVKPLTSSQGEQKKVTEEKKELTQVEKDALVGGSN